MKTQSPDTSPAIEQRQIAGLRRFSPARRLALTDALTAEVRQMSWNAFCQRYAQLSETERRRRWIAFLYGEDLAARVAAYLQQRQGRS